MLATIYQSTRCHAPEDLSLHRHSWEPRIS